MLEKGVKYAFGGKLANSFLVCGGWDENGVRLKECYKVGKPTPFLELLQPRFYAASVALPNNTLLITGESSYIITLRYQIRIQHQIRVQAVRF